MVRRRISGGRSGSRGRKRPGRPSGGAPATDSAVPLRREGELPEVGRHSGPGEGGVELVLVGGERGAGGGADATDGAEVDLVRAPGAAVQRAAVDRGRLGAVIVG